MREAVVTGAGAFGVYLVVVLALLRAINGMAPSRIVTVASVVVYAGALAVASVATARVWFWPVSATYWFLTLCFLMVFGALYKSISLRVLHDLSTRPQRSDRYDAILSRYIEGESYQDRIRVLLASGLADRQTGGFRPTSKGRRLAAALERLQGMYKIERSG